jgi:hypothetical protein
VNLPRLQNSKAIFAHEGRERISAITRLRAGGPSLADIDYLQFLKANRGLLVILVSPRLGKLSGSCLLR